MLKVVGCFVDAHDHRLVLLAALICAMAAATAVELLCYARRASGRARWDWLAVASVASGSGIWATHFVAMLAFSPGLPAAYDVVLTVFSLLAAIVITAMGFAIAILGAWPWAAALGGTVVGGGIATMHYTGMNAYQVAGRISWDPVTVVVSIALGAILGAAALVITFRTGSVRSKLGGASLLLLAIVSHHFTAMGAVEITPDPRLKISEHAVDTAWLAGGIALASILILVLACAALAVDVRERRRAAGEIDRLQGLANAAVEGLVVYRDGVIASANEAFVRMIGFAPDAPIAGQPVVDFLPATADGVRIGQIETQLRQADGTWIPVELITRRIAYGNAPHQAAAIRDLRARQRAEREIHFLAHHDALTGLANRASFSQRFDLEITAARAAGTKVAVLCLDLDRFKEINDLFGHAAGDLVLQQVGHTITGLLGHDQVLSRLGGDEFAILLPCKRPTEAGDLAERILAAFADDRSGPTTIATSIGIAIFPDDATDAETLLGSADTALYRSKREGRGIFRFFEQRMGEEVRERRLMEHDLRHAAANGELRLVYQPQTDLASGRITGFEALLRWKHLTRGFVSPDVFIPIAEESGSILTIGEWVLREGCREAATWRNDLTIAINVSAIQVHSGDLVSMIHGILFETGLNPARLEIELTETALIREPNRALQTMRRLKALGLCIAMDDFGTGYSSLSNLRSFPFDKLKIDRSFIQEVHANPHSAAIVSSVLMLGEGLDMTIVAEGVETDDELGFLVSHHCQSAQGFLLGRPKSIEAYGATTGKGENEAIAAETWAA